MNYQKCISCRESISTYFTGEQGLFLTCKITDQTITITKCVEELSEGNLSEIPTTTIPTPTI